MLNSKASKLDKKYAAFLKANKNFKKMIQIKVNDKETLQNYKGDENF